MTVDERVRTDIDVDGMTCAACASRIQRRLAKLEGVDAAQVNFANGRAVVTHSSSIGETLLTSEIEALGYRVILDGDSSGVENER